MPKAPLAHVIERSQVALLIGQGDGFFRAVGRVIRGVFVDRIAAVGELLAAHTLWSALSDLHLRQDTVAAFDGSPISVARPAERIAGVVILRAGMLFSRPFQALLPHAPLYQVGIRRDEETLTPAVYTSNVPQAPGWADRVLVLDPMVATGGSTARAIAEV
ncbi:MAG: hypothetical protein DCC67_13055, partial [Planctomycetota bacterium]